MRAKTHPPMRRWLLPDAEGWTAGPLQGTARVPVEPSGFHREKAEGVVWPVGALSGLPLWLAGEDASAFAGAARLQLEKRKLGERVLHPSTVQVREIAREGGRTLVLAWGLSRQVKDAHVPVGARVQISALDALPWPENRIVLFRENGRWVLVATRGRQPVYFQALATVLGSETGRDLACVAAALGQEGVAPDVAGVTAWDAIGTEAEASIRQATGWPVSLVARPAWSPQPAAAALAHPAVAAHRVRQDRLRTARRAGLALAAVLLILLGVAGGRAGWASWELEKLERERDALQAEAAPIREAARRWRRVEGSIEASRFPLEQLRAVAEKLPPSGVRLTEFQWKDGTLRLTGEASDTTMAFAYAEGLKGVAGFAWEMEPPSIQPNNSAQFVVKGTP